MHPPMAGFDVEAAQPTYHGNMRCADFFFQESAITSQRYDGHVTLINGDCINDIGDAGQWGRCGEERRPSWLSRILG